MWFFKSKDLRDYSCDFKNSWSFWNFSENARAVFFCFRFWLTELHEPAQWTFWLLALRPENFKFSNPKISGTIHTIRIIFADPESTRASREQFFFFWIRSTEARKRGPWSFCLFGSCRYDFHAEQAFTIDFVEFGWLGEILSNLLHTKATIHLKCSEINGLNAGYRFSVNSQCLELPEPL